MNSQNYLCRWGIQINQEKQKNNTNQEYFFKLTFQNYLMRIKTSTLNIKNRSNALLNLGYEGYTVQEEQNTTKHLQWNSSNNNMRFLKLEGVQSDSQQGQGKRWGKRETIKLEIVSTISNRGQHQLHEVYNANDKEFKKERGKLKKKKST